MNNKISGQKKAMLSGFGVAFLGVSAIFTQAPTLSAKTQTEKQAPSKSVAKPAKEDKVVKTDAEWRKVLTPEQFDVLRNQGTEKPGSGALLHNHDKGVFVCAACGKELFSSDTKFESGTGWPSFWAPLTKTSVSTRTDADGERSEVTCPRCGGHLGHVFNDGPKPTGLRYCMNSVALKFNKKP